MKGLKIEVASTEAKSVIDVKVEDMGGGTTRIFYDAEESLASEEDLESLASNIWQRSNKTMRLDFSLFDIGILTLYRNALAWAKRGGGILTGDLVDEIIDFVFTGRKQDAHIIVDIPDVSFDDEYFEYDGKIIPLRRAC